MPASVSPTYNVVQCMQCDLGHSLRYATLLCTRQHTKDREREEPINHQATRSLSPDTRGQCTRKRQHRTAHSTESTDRVYTKIHRQKENGGKKTEMGRARGKRQEIRSKKQEAGRGIKKRAVHMSRIFFSSSYGRKRKKEKEGYR